MKRYSPLLLIAMPVFRSSNAFSIISRHGITRVPANVAGPTRALWFSSSSTSSDRLFEENLNIIYDSKCSVCKWEIDFLASRDERVNHPNRKLKMTDIEDPNYNPNDPANAQVSYAQGMASMHAVTPDGKVLNGVPVFRVAYEQVGLGWLFAITTWPMMKPAADAAYHLFAKYRTQVTRNSTLEDLVQAYEERKKMVEEKKEDCEVCETKTR